MCVGKTLSNNGSCEWSPNKKRWKNSNLGGLVVVSQRTLGSLGNIQTYNILVIVQLFPRLLYSLYLILFTHGYMMYAGKIITQIQ